MQGLSYVPIEVNTRKRPRCPGIMQEDCILKNVSLLRLFRVGGGEEQTKRKLSEPIATIHT